ncbi:hypothetical protein EJ02DRAFT_259078 [Clathrospora elynae]|uniref:Uncharacterized protein n=1 Tax=Clathrospora elynae TaxID=706981 RepID=A0A6A5SI78_9PLEO|nr:hypothetical protein EJ02DRAFT_259078 [Clathrospora elynae]
MASRGTSMHCTLEPVPKSEIASSYIYSVPDSSSPIVVADYGEEAQQQQQQPHMYLSDAPTPPAAARNSVLKRWIFPLVYYLVIAIVAGVAGGFIGKAVSDKTHKNDAPAQQNHTASCPTLPSTNTSSSSPPPTTSALSTVFARTLPVPTTGCSDSNFLKPFPSSLTSTSTFLNTTYTTFCQAGWNRDELFALSAATPSDCVEACVMYNGHKGGADRLCVGGGFIPEWWNQSKAMDESGGMPYNCFLKSNGSGVARNDRRIEVVSLCLFGDASHCAETEIGGS